jgi:GNAT superfamily N-acetyltransferase
MISTKKATLEELNELSILFDGYRVFYKKESNLTEGKKFLRERIEKNESEIIVSYNSENEMTGFVQLYPIFSSTRMKKLWLLNDLFVHPNFRGQGISKVLIERSKELCLRSGSCGMILETAKSNMIGNDLYPRTGFALDDEHNYYCWDTK